MILRMIMMSSCLLGVGLLAICLEAHRIRIGHRIQKLLHQEEAQVERLRRLLIRYNRMVSPDLLLRDLPEEFRGPPPGGPALE